MLKNENQLVKNELISFVFLPAIKKIVEENRKKQIPVLPVLF